MKMYQIFASMTDRQRYAVKYHVKRGTGVNDAVTLVYLHGVGHLINSDYNRSHKNV